MPNPQRPALRPANDKLDRFVALCVEKLDAGLDQIKGLAEEVERMQQDIAASHAGGDPELRTQLSKANKEIHRLRTLLATQPGAVFDEEEGEAPPEQVLTVLFVDFLFPNHQFLTRTMASSPSPCGEPGFWGFSLKILVINPRIQVYFSSNT